MTVNKLAEMIEELPAEKRQRIEEYISSMSKVSKHGEGSFRFDWAGGLSEFRGKYTSVELQKKAMEWMSEVSR